MFDVISIESIARYVDNLRGLMNGTTNGISIKSKTNTCQKSFKKRFAIGGYDRSPQYVNFSNVWSFLPPTKVQYGKSAIKHQHPTQKPLELMKRLVELTTPPGGIVLDPFAGSGTTAIACLETGRQYICIEQSEEYYQMILARIADWEEEKAQATQQLELL